MRIWPTLVTWWSRVTTLWRCPTCGKYRRTLTLHRQSLPPVCLHWHTPFGLYSPRRMRAKTLEERHGRLR